MAIVLFEHNNEAYKAAVSMLKKEGKAAVIHPTGTGKSFIGFKLCEDNPNKTICWLSPSKYIFGTQIENLKKASNGYEPNNITFLTYAKLMNMSIEEIEELRPDFIVLDEFHRCGAEEWGKGVDRLLDMYSNVPMLGLSATAIRYLDNQRDMSDELFDGRVASEMSLGEAIVRGILNPPKYILSIFSYKEELDRYEERVRQSRNKAVKDKAELIIEQLRRALDKAEGLDEVFAKHMTDKFGKYIVFCANYEAMQEAMKKTDEWFRLIDKKPHIYSVYSEDPMASESYRGFINDSDRSLRLLFCIDALNEGVHVDDISGVILLRPTVSPIIYKQQIGRALSASKKTDPIVFDIVNNIKNLYSIDAVKDEMQAAIQYMTETGGEGKIVNNSFKVIDELCNCLDLFNELEDTLSASWEIMYLEAKRYYEEFGNLMVPADYMTEAGYGLGRWIRTQRIARINQDNITDEQIEKLDAIGMCWNKVLSERWNAHYELAKDYYTEHGNLLVTRDCVVETDKYPSLFPKGECKLGIWISGQRENYSKRHLQPEQIEKLKAIGMCWDRYDEKWEIGYSYACRYYKEHEDINFVPSGFMYGDFNLHRWLHNQRTGYRKGKLSEERVRRLEEVGFKWSVNEAFWEKGYGYAREYKRLHGNLSVPQGYTCEDGFKLSCWLKNQITRKKKGNLSERQIMLLSEVGIQ